MSDIHQEWRELRKKNGDFICHLDGEMAKLENMERHAADDLIDGAKIAIIADQNRRIKNLQIIVDGLSAKNDELLRAAKIDKDQIERMEKALNLGDQNYIAMVKENEALKHKIATLHGALDIAAKDADANFDRGYHKGMDKLWDAIRKAQEEHPKVLRDIYGQGCMHDCVSNLSAQDFANKTIEWEEKQAKDIQIGDEVEILDIYDPDLRGDIGIVVVADSERHSFVAVGPNFESCFDETDIRDGNVRKTGQHFDSIPLAYFA